MLNRDNQEVVSDKLSVVSTARGFTLASEERHENLFSWRPSDAKAKALRAFTLIELMVVIAIIGMLASVVFASIADSQKNARDKRRIADMQQLHKAFELYLNDHNDFPREWQGMNGDISTNETLLGVLEQYLNGVPFDPSGIGNATAFYYYDGAHTCGTTDYAIIFARHMDKPENSNYSELLNVTCSGSLDGEGRGGGTQSYNIILGPTNDF